MERQDFLNLAQRCAAPGSARRMVAIVGLPAVLAVGEKVQHRPGCAVVVPRPEHVPSDTMDLAVVVLRKRRETRPIGAGLGLEPHVLGETAPLNGDHSELPAAAASE